MFTLTSVSLILNVLSPSNSLLMTKDFYVTICIEYHFSHPCAVTATIFSYIPHEHLRSHPSRSRVTSLIKLVPSDRQLHQPNTAAISVKGPHLAQRINQNVPICLYVAKDSLSQSDTCSGDTWVPSSQPGAQFPCYSSLSSFFNHTKVLSEALFNSSLLFSNFTFQSVHIVAPVPLPPSNTSDL